MTLWRWLGTSADPGCINEPEQRASLYNPSRVRSNLDGTVVYQTRQVIRLWHLLFRFTGKPTPVRIRLHSRPIPRAVCIAPAAQSATGIVPAATATAASPQSPSSSPPGDADVIFVAPVVETPPNPCELLLDHCANARELLNSSCERHDVVSRWQESVHRARRRHRLLAASTGSRKKSLPRRQCTRFPTLLSAAQIGPPRESYGALCLQCEPS